MIDTDRIYEERCFLRDVLLLPDDDAPRLIFADRLDEWGETDRAAFIRVGCERAAMDHGTNPKLRFTHLFRKKGQQEKRAKYESLLNAEQQLATRLNRWINELWKFPPTEISQLSFRRGFCNQVACSGIGWLTWSKDLVWEHGIDELPKLTMLPIKVVILTSRLPGHIVTDRSEHIQRGLRLSTALRYNRLMVERRERSREQQELVVLQEMWPKISFEFDLTSSVGYERRFRAIARGVT